MNITNNNSNIKGMSYNEIELLMNKIYDYTFNTLDLSSEDLQKIKDLRDLDTSIPTYNEMENDSRKLIMSEHSPARIATFLLSYYAEHAAQGALLTIEDDDPVEASVRSIARHDNTYSLQLHDLSTHEFLFAGKASNSIPVHDIDAIFRKQITFFKTSGVSGDTTKKPFASFYEKGKVIYNYKQSDNKRNPYRKIEIKSCLWTSGSHTHGADYVLRFGRSEFDGFRLLDAHNNLKEKEFTLNMTSEGREFYEKYCNLIDNFSKFTSIKYTDLIKNDINEEDLC